jgi:hypothetical protein
MDATYNNHFGIKWEEFALDLLDKRSERNNRSLPSLVWKSS